MHFVNGYHQVNDAVDTVVEDKKPELPFILPSPINLAYFNANAHKQPKTAPAPAPASVYNSVKLDAPSLRSMQMNALYSGMYSPIKQAMLKSYSVNRMQPSLVPVDNSGTAYAYPMLHDGLYMSPAAIARKRRRGITKRTLATSKLGTALASAFPDAQLGAASLDDGRAGREAPNPNHKSSLAHTMASLDNGNVTIAQLKQIASNHGIEKSGKKQELLTRLRRAAHLPDIDLAANLKAPAIPNEPSPATSLSSYLNVEDLFANDKVAQSTPKSQTFYDFPLGAGLGSGGGIDNHFESQLLSFSPMLSFYNDNGISQNGKEESSLYNPIFQ